MQRSRQNGPKNAKSQLKVYMAEWDRLNRDYQIRLARIEHTLVADWVGLASRRAQGIQSE
jgi:hypothetical protein